MRWSFAVVHSASAQGRRDFALVRPNFALVHRRIAQERWNFAVVQFDSAQVRWDFAVVFPSFAVVQSTSAQLHSRCAPLQSWSAQKLGRSGGHHELGGAESGSAVPKPGAAAPILALGAPGWRRAERDLTFRAGTRKL